jgi:hypothetical protein
LGYRFIIQEGYVIVPYQAGRNQKAKGKYQKAKGKIQAPFAF